MIEPPKVNEDQQKQFRDDFISMLEQHTNQDELEAFRTEWDGAVNFQIVDDHTVIVNIAGEEKLPTALKQKTRNMCEQFNRGDYHPAT